MIVHRIKGRKLFWSWKNNMFLLFYMREFTDLSNLMISQEVPAMEPHPLFLADLFFVLPFYCAAAYPTLLGTCSWRMCVTNVVYKFVVISGVWVVESQRLQCCHEAQTGHLVRSSTWKRFPAGARSASLTHTEGFRTWILGKRQLAKKRLISKGKMEQNKMISFSEGNANNFFKRRKWLQNKIFAILRNTNHNRQ